MPFVRKLRRIFRESIRGPAQTAGQAQDPVRRILVFKSIGKPHRRWRPVWFRLSKNPPGEEPRRVESSADDGRKGCSVISGDMRVGNDTSHDGQGDFSARIEPCPSCIPLSEKAKGLFRQAEPHRRWRPVRLFQVPKRCPKRRRSGTYENVGEICRRKLTKCSNSGMFKWAAAEDAEAQADQESSRNPY